MMYLLLILCISSVAQCSANKPTIALDPKFVAQISEKAVICSSEAGAGPELLEKLLPWRLEESETSGKFLICLSRELKCDAKDGHLNVDKFIALFETSLKSHNVDEFRKLMTECNKETGKNRYITIYKIADCFHTKSPVDMALQ